MKKNVSGQRWRVFAFLQTTSAPVTGDSANITAAISLDYGGEGAVTDTHPSEIGGGYYEFDLSQAETNADCLELRPSSTTESVSLVPCPATVYTGDMASVLEDTGTTLPATLATIKAKTDLIGSGSVTTVRASVSSDGLRLTLTRGDAYLASAGEAIRWTFATGAARNLSTASSVRFTARDLVDEILIDSASATVIQSGTATQIVDVELTTLQTKDLPASTHANDVVGYYDLEADYGSGDYTTLIRRGKLIVIGDETRH